MEMDLLTELDNAHKALDKAGKQICQMLNIVNKDAPISKALILLSAAAKQVGRCQARLEMLNTPMETAPETFPVTEGSLLGSLLDDATCSFKAR